MSSQPHSEEFDAAENESELLVIGAGPAGVSAALAARSLGIDVTILEAESEDRERPGSRALFVHQENLRRFNRMSPGLGDKIAGFGIVWRSRRTLYGDREIFSKWYPAPSSRGIPPYASLRQVDTEQFLLDACHDAGVRFGWDTPVEQVDTTPDQVVVHTSEGAQWRTKYLIGADGSRSAVRKALNISLEGGVRRITA